MSADTPRTDERDARVTIEWHNEQVQQFIDTQDSLLAERDEARVEVERLRAALQRIIEEVGVGAADIVVANTLLGRVKMHATRALTTQEEGDEPI